MWLWVLKLEMEEESNCYSTYQTSSSGNSFYSLIHLKRKHLCLPTLRGFGILYNQHSQLFQNQQFWSMTDKEGLLCLSAPGRNQQTCGRHLICTGGTNAFDSACKRWAGRMLAYCTLWQIPGDERAAGVQSNPAPGGEFLYLPPDHPY